MSIWSIDILGAYFYDAYQHARQQRQQLLRQALHDVALHDVANSKTEQIARLLSYGFGVNRPIFYGKTLVFFVRNAKTLQFLIDNGADITIQDDNRENILHELFDWYNQECKFYDDEDMLVMLDIILKLHPELSAQVGPHGTPLCYAMRRYKADHSEIKLEHIRKLIACSELARTPDEVCCAIQLYLDDVLELLIYYGADIFSKNSNGKTVLEFAHIWNNKNAIALLKKAIEEDIPSRICWI